MKIGFDLDYTLAYFKVPYWVAANQMCGLKPFVPKEYGLHMFTEDVKNICFSLFMSEWYMVDLLVPYVNSLLTVSQLVSKGHDIIIITTRPKEVRPATINWVDKNLTLGSKNYVKDIFFVDEHNEKIDIFKREKIGVWVDDHPNNCVAAQNMGVSTFLVNQPFNAYYVLPNVERINDTTELFNYPFFDMVVRGS